MKSFLENYYQKTIGVGSILALITFVSYLYTLVSAGLSSGDLAYELFNIWVVIPFLFCSLLGLLIFRKRPANWWISLVYIILSLLCVFSVSLFLFSDNALGSGLVILLMILPTVCIISLLLIIKLVKKNE